MTGLRARLEAIEADIANLDRDAIVNAANSALMPGGGVDGAIRRKAGPDLEEALYEIGRCETGQAVVTPGFRLPARFIIHTVAPVWGLMERGIQERLLRNCYDSVLSRADEKQIRTLAFPGIGTGAYGWPADIAASIAFAAVTEHLKQCAVQTKVTFCCFTRADRERYEGLIAALKD